MDLFPVEERGVPSLQGLSTSRMTSVGMSTKMELFLGSGHKFEFVSRVSVWFARGFLLLLGVIRDHLRLLWLTMPPPVGDPVWGWYSGDCVFDIFPYMGSRNTYNSGVGCTKVIFSTAPEVSNVPLSSVPPV